MRLRTESGGQDRFYPADKILSAVPFLIALQSGERYSESGGQDGFYRADKTLPAVRFLIAGQSGEYCLGKRGTGWFLSCG